MSRTGALAMLVALPMAAQRLSVSQVRAVAPEFLAHVVVEGAPAPEAKHFRATFGKDRLAVAELRKFDPAKEGVAYIALFDVSKSLGKQEAARVREALQTFADALAPSDRLALLAFGDQVRQLSDFTADKAALRERIADLKPLADRTALYLALKKAFEIGSRLDPGLPLRRAVLVLTDGQDDGSGITVDDVLRELQQNRVPVFAIGASRLAPAEKTRSFDLLKRIAENSGGAFVETDKVDGAYGLVRDAVTGVFVARMTCASCVADARPERLRLELAAGDKVMSAGIDVRLLPGAPLPSRPERPKWIVAVAVAAGIVCLLGLTVLVARRRREPASVTAAAETLSRPVAITAARAAESAVQFDKSPNVSPGGPHLQITVIRGNKPGASHEFVLADRTVIGSGEGAQVRIEGEKTMSARHVQLSRESGRFFVSDLGSTNGTLLNGVPLRNQQPLTDGDLITAGLTEMRVKIL